MDPVIDSGANAIEFVPTSEEDINVGDIISYTSPYTTGPVIHRVIDIGEDENGKYYILKGDNNPRADPGKIRFEDIQRVVLAIIY
ncbi:signal peptidase I [Candidatus Woesearchaeota archaeon]|nr:MAG: signal peptidase I [Candidatus Woesearchaeota archaeon]